MRALCVAFQNCSFREGPPFYQTASVSNRGFIGLILQQHEQASEDYSSHDVHQVRTYMSPSLEVFPPPFWKPRSSSGGLDSVGPSLITIGHCIVLESTSTVIPSTPSSFFIAATNPCTVL